MRSRELGTVMAVLLLIATAGACSSDSDPTGNEEDEDVVVIRLTGDFRFSPATVTIAPGTRVRWVNDAAGFHTVTPEEPGQAGVWQRAEFNATGQTFEFTFEVAGQEYDYFCEPHRDQGMTGRVIVE